MIAQVLSKEQIGKVHDTSLRILERIGVVVPHEEMLARFADAGARVDRAAQRVRIPGELVMRCVGQAGKRFRLYGRDPERTAVFGEGQRNHSSISGETYWLDEPGGERRFAAMQDVVAATRCGEAIERLTIVGAMADPHEIPVEHRCVEVMAEMFRHTTKPITQWFHNRASARFIGELVLALRGSIENARAKPVTFTSLEPISPLRFPFDGVDLLWETARLEVPCGVAPMAQMGVSAPMSVAGTLVAQNAEVLAGICVTQLVKPGLPVLYCGTCHAFDMSTTQMIFGGPEQALFGVAMTQVGRSYGLPVSVNVGLTDSKRIDAQAGLEIGITRALAAAAGAEGFGLLGICGVDQAASLDMLMFQHEAIGYIESVMRELDFSDEALGFDLLEQLGPGGQFLDQEHTARRVRRELWMPRLFDRRYYQAWFDDGAESMEARRRRRREEILHAPAAEPLAPDVEKVIAGIVSAARRELAGG